MASHDQVLRTNAIKRNIDKGNRSHVWMCGESDETVSHIVEKAV